MFGVKKQPLRYDPARQQPVLKCGICTGEQVAAFQDKATGQVREVMLVRTAKDLETFRAAYGVPPDCPILKVY